MFKAKLLASRDDVQLPCCGKSLFLTENDKSFVMFDSCQTTATWRTMLYPSSSKATSSSKSLQKSNSFSGSSGNSFNGVIYMKWVQNKLYIGYFLSVDLTMTDRLA